MTPLVHHYRLAAAALMTMLMAGSVHAAMVQVAVTGVHDARGHIRVDLCTRDTFLKTSCPYSGEAAATPGATIVSVPGVAPGQYAAQVFHDETDQGVIHQNLLGIPKEAIGFSNDAHLGLHGPKFKDAAFSVGQGVERITLKLRRLLGPDR